MYAPFRLPQNEPIITCEVLKIHHQIRRSLAVRKGVGKTGKLGVMEGENGGG